jgi:hypothetical protein
MGEEKDPIKNNQSKRAEAFLRPWLKWWNIYLASEALSSKPSTAKMNRKQSRGLGVWLK